MPALPADEVEIVRPAEAPPLAPPLAIRRRRMVVVEKRVRLPQLRLVQPVAFGREPVRPLPAIDAAAHGPQRLPAVVAGRPLQGTGGSAPPGRAWAGESVGAGLPENGRRPRGKR